MHTRHIFQITLFLSFFAQNKQTFCQKKYDYNWILGYSYNIPNGGLGMLLNFENQSLALSSFNLPDYITIQQNSSISDKDGNLQFYANGCKIVNYQNNFMINGDSLLPGTQSEEGHCAMGYAFIQSTISLPAPGSDHEYYVFSINGPGRSPYLTDLLYAKVDMDLDGGEGQVVEKSHLLLQDSLTDQLTAVRHGNGRDWWIVVPKQKTNTYFLFLLDKNGLSGPKTDTCGSMGNDMWGSQAVFSHDGSMYARTGRDQRVQLMYFDRCAGHFFCPKTLTIPVEPPFGAAGVGFSPSNRFLYASFSRFLYQFDLKDIGLKNKVTPILIDRYDGFQSPPLFAVTFFQQLLAPDGKIYMCSANGNDYLHVINDPDSLGVACNFKQHSIHLPSYNSTSLPNFPDFRLTALRHSLCDTLDVATPPGQTDTEWFTDKGISVRPNLVRDIANIALPACQSGQLRIFNSIGQCVYLYPGAVHGPETLELDVTLYPPGVYEVVFTYDKKYFYRARMLVMR